MRVADNDDVAIRLEGRQVAFFQHRADAGLTVVGIGHAERQRVFVDDDGTALARLAFHRLEAIADLHGDDGRLLTVWSQRAEAQRAEGREVAKLHGGGRSLR